MKNSIAKQRINIAIVGCGIAGRSHIVECLFNEQIKIIAVCAKHIATAKSTALEFDIPLYFDSVRQCVDAIKDKIDILVFSIPPLELEKEINYCAVGKFTIICDKPGVVINCRQLQERVFIYYSRRSYLPYNDAVLEVSKALEGNGVIEYICNGPYSQRYTINKYLNRAKEGVIKDTASHYIDILLEAISWKSSQLKINDVTMGVKPETWCLIKMSYRLVEIFIKINDIKNGKENWRINFKNSSNEIQHSFFSDNFYENYNSSFTFQLIEILKNGKSKTFIPYSKYSKILSVIDRIYNYSKT